MNIYQEQISLMKVVDLEFVNCFVRDGGGGGGGGRKIIFLACRAELDPNLYKEVFSDKTIIRQLCINQFYKPMNTGYCYLQIKDLL